MRFLNKSVTLEGALEGDTAFRIWRRHLARHAPAYAGGALAVLATNVTEVMIPKFLQWGIDALAAPGAPLGRYVSGVAALLALQFAGRVLWRQKLGQQTHYAAARLKSQLWDRARYFPKHRLETDLTPGELMSVATGDVGIARYLFGFTIVGTVDFLFLLALSIGAMLSIDVPLTLITLAVLPGLPFIVNRLARQESRQHRAAQDGLSKLTDLIAQAVSTQRLQRVSQTHRFWEAKLGESADDYRRRRLDVIRTSLAFIPVTGLAPLISFGVLLALGVHKVLQGQLSVGQFVALQSYVFLIQQPMLDLGVIVSEWQRGGTSLDRVVRTLAQPEAPGLRAGGVAITAPDDAAAATAATAVAALAARRLGFTHHGAARPVLQNISFTLRPGGRLGVTGPIGAGKTTLLQILAGLEPGFDGEVSVYGTPIARAEHASLRACLGVVPQKPFLFGDTIRNNLCLDRALSDEELWHWCEVAGVAEDLREIEGGLAAKLGEWGVNLSGGQKQRLTLARALARRPSILLIDDALSAVDTVTEERILRNLDRELAASTLVWVAHRPSTLRHCTDFLALAPPPTADAPRPGMIS